MNNDTDEKTRVYNTTSNIQNTTNNTTTTGSRPSSASATTGRIKASDRPASTPHTPHTTYPNKVPKNAHSNNYIKQYMLYKAQEKDFGALDILQQPSPSLPSIHKNRPSGNVYYGTLTNRDDDEEGVEGHNYDPSEMAEAEEEEGEGEDDEGYVSNDGMHYYRH